MHLVSTHPDPADLVAYVDGEAAPEVAAHVRQCAECTREAGALGQTARQLVSRLYRFDCPDPLTLGEYALDVLDPERRRLVAAHALECEECTTELHTVREYLAVDPPATESLGGRVRRLVATLLPSSGPGLAVAGLRGVGDDSTRVYEAGAARVSLKTGDEAGYVMGLLEDEGDLQGRMVRLVSTSASVVFETTLDDLGNFELESIPEGTYALELELANGLAVVDPLQVR